ncbi:VOC family protein [Macrococcus lamae]|uniref:VOC family protein n=1 Tax=Macrococcus lamae TaxID=198484 RepID=A0A4R6BTF3_9STAP|nr:VOC family protein [Macrococcus lamae]TDM07931.1 VOC family protein [Macrococcus lamae]
MIQSLHQVMLYVENLEQSVAFWQEQLGFKIVNQQELPEGYQSFEMAPATINADQTSIVLFDKAFIKKFSPEVSLETPSLMFKTADVDALYNDLKAKGVTVGEKLEMPGMKVFNFADTEGNYFAVSELN